MIASTGKQTATAEVSHTIAQWPKEFKYGWICPFLDPSQEGIFLSNKVMNKYLEHLKISLYLTERKYKTTGNYSLKLDIEELRELIAVTEAHYA